MRTGAAIGIGVACAVAHQTAGHDKLASDPDRRHAMTRGERRQLPTPGVEQQAATDKQCAGARLNDSRKGSIDFAYGLRSQGQELTSEFACSGRHLFFSALRNSDLWDRAAKQWWLARAPTHAAALGALALEPSTQSSPR